jgi:hypothetical protein
MKSCRDERPRCVAREGGLRVARTILLKGHEVVPRLEGAITRSPSPGAAGDLHTAEHQAGWHGKNNITKTSLVPESANITLQNLSSVGGNASPGEMFRTFGLKNDLASVVCGVSSAPGGSASADRFRPTHAEFATSARGGADRSICPLSV